MGSKRQKKSETGPPVAGMTTESSTTTPNVRVFLFFGLVTILGISSLHTIFSGVLSFILGKEFLTVIYATAAILITGAACKVLHRPHSQDTIQNLASQFQKQDRHLQKVKEETKI